MWCSPDLPSRAGSLGTELAFLGRDCDPLPHAAQPLHRGLMILTYMRWGSAALWWERWQDKTFTREKFDSFFLNVGQDLFFSCLATNTKSY